MVAIARYVDIEQNIVTFTAALMIHNFISIHTVADLLRCVVKQLDHVFVDSDDRLCIVCAYFFQKPIGLQFQFFGLR